MSTDLILAILHHLGVFTVAGVIAAELVLIRPGMSMDKILQAAKIDALYGIAAGSVLFIGFARAIAAARIGISTKTCASIFT